ncbi:MULTISPECIES: VWA domain-containing protein [unclassified Cyanobium]|uniref:vWA domain-containing protein n=1 Tax=unclassified Cyanobium TaxID=2627006 RepID=UPI0020CEACA4|nr:MULTISPECIES: VWA domain-containing protein [unclassified Cyanobium]MCP9835492.1 VWA domain-containing protein [Cyanobium sp. La Preciosa 7G6]MCP9938258.1 VWA domain-containing protein [Cyanobium sp. Aljojuca 7A6]
MTRPTLRFRPLRPAVASDRPSILDLLLTITPPPAAAEANRRERPPLNLALVIDRSGSMGGTKLSYARKAARFLAGELTSRDRLAIVSFDDEVQIVVASRPVADPQPFIAAINTIDSGGCTALFDGWRAGATQVAEHLDPAAMNRVLLLSDGQANEGLTNQDQIAAKVAGLTQRGISTSAFGLGDDFDEDLMGAMAAAGDGTLAHIETPSQLADLYASELRGLASTFGRRVSLGLRGKHGAEVVDLLNDLKRTGAGNYQLPNLRAGQELNVGLRLELPAWIPNQEILSVRLAWEAPGSGDRQSLIEHLQLPVMAHGELDQLDGDEAVAEQLALFKANRERKRVITELDRGDVISASASLGKLFGDLSAMPATPRLTRELDLLSEKLALLKSDPKRSRKNLRRESQRSSLNVWESEGGPRD